MSRHMPLDVAVRYLNNLGVDGLHGIFSAISDAMRRTGTKPGRRVRFTPAGGGVQDCPESSIVGYCESLEVDPKLERLPDEETHNLQVLYAVVAGRLSAAGYDTSVDKPSDEALT